MHSNRYTSERIPEAVELRRLKLHLIQCEVNVCRVKEGTLHTPGASC